MLLQILIPVLLHMEEQLLCMVKAIHMISIFISCTIASNWKLCLPARRCPLCIDSTHGVQSRFHCFLQNDQGQLSGSSVINGIIFQENSAELEGQSVYISDAQSCSNGFNSNAMHESTSICRI